MAELKLKDLLKGKVGKSKEDKDSSKENKLALLRDLKKALDNDKLEDAVDSLDAYLDAR